MKPDPEKSNELGKLVELLHHMPAPKPGNLSARVIEGIKSPRPSGPLTWSQRLGLDFEKQPVLVCAVGAVVCGLLIYGLITSLHVEQPVKLPGELLQGSALAPQPDGLRTGTPGLPPEADRGQIPSSITPVLTPNQSPFNSAVDRAAEKVGYSVGGN